MKKQYVFDRMIHGELTMLMRKVISDKKRYIELLLLADEEEAMIDRYLERGDMYVAEFDGTPGAVAVVTDEGDGVLEIKNLAVAPELQKRGIGRAVIEFIKNEYRDCFQRIIVGTGDSPSTTVFYERCGFKRAYVVEDFFTVNYSHPIIDGGVLLKDMVYFAMDI